MIIKIYYFYFVTNFIIVNGGIFVYQQYKGRIVNIEKYQSRSTYVEQGVKKWNQGKYKNYLGGRGTYVVGGEYLGTVLAIKVYVYDLNKSITVDVYEEILKYMGKQRISSQLMEIIEACEGSKVVLETLDHKSFRLDVGQLIG